RLMVHSRYQDCRAGCHLLGSDPEARATDILQWLRVVAPFVVRADDRAILRLDDAWVADVLVDAGVVPVDVAAFDLAGGRRHAARTGGLRHRLTGHAAFANDELVLHVPG